jgi:long-chain acyl-CoA synthetase
MTSFDMQHIQSIFCGAFDTGAAEDVEEEAKTPPGTFVEKDILRNSLCKEELVKYTSAGDSVVTLYETFQHGVQRDPSADCMGKRADADSPYVWKSYQAIQQEAASVGSYLKELGIAPNQRIGLSGKNAPEYLTALLGCFVAGTTTVPIYDTFGATECQYIMKQADVQCVFVSADNLSKIVEWSSEIASVKKIIVWGSSDEETDENDKVITYEECVKLGDASLGIATPPTPEDLAIIMYTSGTT